jgi:hypothetical protein
MTAMTPPLAADRTQEGVEEGDSRRYDWIPSAMDPQGDKGGKK